MCMMYYFSRNVRQVWRLSKLGTGARPASFAAGMDLDLAALSLPGGMLTAPLGAVPPSMTLLEALQTRQARDMLSVLEAARAPSRHPLDISLQARMSPHSLHDPSSACYAAGAWVARQQSTPQGSSLTSPWRRVGHAWVAAR